MSDALPSSAMRISVVIPTYNRLAYLQQALESVLSQTRMPDEIIVVDDGSTDHTKREIGSRGDLLYVRQENLGAAAARNRGIREAKGDWVAFLDSDDLWHPTKLEIQEKAWSRAPAHQLILCDSEPVDAQLQPLSGHRKPIRGGEVTRALFNSTFIHTPTVLAQRDLLLQLSGFKASLRVCEDLDLWLRASLETPFLAVLEVLISRRVHGDSLAHADRPENHEDKCSVLEEFARDERAALRIPEQEVRRRLARVHFLAARAYRRRGNRQKVAEHMARARSLCPLNLRHWRPSWMMAKS